MMESPIILKRTPRRQGSNDFTEGSNQHTMNQVRIQAKQVGQAQATILLKIPMWLPSVPAPRRPRTRQA